MNAVNLKIKVQHIVEQATAIKNKHIDNKNTPINYACIFSQNKDEYDDLIQATRKIGNVIEKTPTGLLFQISPLKTVSGALKLLKIRIPDVSRPEQGDADFTVANFHDFKKKYISRNGFKLIKKRQGFEMLELVDPEFDVRAYFSNPPLDVQLGIK